MDTTFYVTTPIYYVTAAPHLGSLYSTLLADVAARYHMLAGKEVFFLTGTDEHGQKVAEAAKRVDMEPKIFADSFIDAYKTTWQQYNIAYNYFIRTTDKTHVQAVQKWLAKLIDQGDIYKGSYTGWYCTPCETFVTEKDSKEEVAQGQAPICSDCSRTTQQVSESCYFFRLSAYQDRLLDFYKQNPNFISPKERLAEITSFVQSGLKDLSISRTTISWGIPFPGDDAHVTYVWADALNNYITAIGYGDEQRQVEFAKWWPADLQILGKDIARFHAIYWPAFLMASGLQLPKKLLVHGWIKVGDKKMSKSLGNAISPDQLAQDYGVDEIRYYLTRKMAITQDSEFRFEDIEQSINSELANAFGNLLNRMATLVVKYEVQKLQAPESWSDQVLQLQQHCQNMVHEAWQLIEDGLFYRAVARIWDFINQVNAYFHEQEPWKVVQEDKDAFVEVMSATAHSLQAIGIMLWPIMPTKMEQMLTSLGVPLVHDKNYIKELTTMSWKNSFLIEKIAALFTKKEIKKSDIMQDNNQTNSVQEQEKSKASEKQDSYITFDDFVKLDLRVGTIIEAQEVADSKKLLKLQVDFGDFGKRQILSGIKEHYQATDMAGKQGIFVVNLKPRKMMGMLSEGMMLFALDESTGLKIVGPQESVKPGTKVG